MVSRRMLLLFLTFPCIPNQSLCQGWMDMVRAVVQGTKNGIICSGVDEIGSLKSCYRMVRVDRATCIPVKANSSISLRVFKALPVLMHGA